jgi:hypothetical protein
VVEYDEAMAGGGEEDGAEMEMEENDTMYQKYRIKLQVSRWACRGTGDIVWDSPPWDG